MNLREAHWIDIWAVCYILSVFSKECGESTLSVKSAHSQMTQALCELCSANPSGQMRGMAAVGTAARCHGLCHY